MKIKFLAFFVLLSSFAFCQMQEFNFKREIKGIDNQWHTISLPNEVYGKANLDFSDLRVFGINAKKDTIEAAFVWENENTDLNNEILPFKILNESSNNEGKFYTFSLEKNANINEINLDFNNKNFDWKVNLEASNDQKKWFKVISDYRILSIKNSETNFSFTTILFPKSNYQFYRIQVKTKEKVDLKNAVIQFDSKNLNQIRAYKTAKQKIFQNKKTKQTIVEVDLEMPVLVNDISINVKNNFDFYRPISIEYLADSIKTENTYRYIYQNIGSGILNSLGKTEIKIDKIIAKKFRIIIENANNPILDIANIKFKGDENKMIVRFLEPATYFLVYGNKNAQKPNFDIEHFKEKIPENISNINLGKEEIIPQKPIKVTEPLFQNKLWLWLIMGIVILLLGFFTLKMMKKDDL